VTACVHCSNRKGKRTCPALGGEICQLCCGKHRLVEISCPPDCRWLHGLSVVRDRPTTFTREQYFAACDRLMAFVDSPANREFRDDAFELFAQELPEGVGVDEAMMVVLRGFLAYADRGSDGLRAIDRFLHRFGHGLSAGEKAALAALQHSWASIFEVEAVATGAGLTLRDRVRGELVEVQEVSATAQLARGDLLFAWLLRVDDHVELTGAGMTIPPQYLEPLLDVIHNEIELVRRDSGEEPPRSFVGELADFMVIDLAELIATAGRPKLVTTHGEELVFCEAHYEVRDVERVRAKLAKQPTVEPQGESGDDYVWLDRRPNKRLAGGPTVLGRIHHDAHSLVLETNSRERLERGRALLGRLVGKALAHKADAFTDVEAKLREPREPRPAEPEVPPEAQAEVVGAFLRDQYLNRWVREPIPALGGRTPRAAVRSKEGRARVAQLIDEAERGSKNMPGGDDPELWNELRASLKLSLRVPRGFGLGYDADRAPDIAEWSAADEAARVAAIRAYHDQLDDHPDAPNPKLHALMHVIVENQLAAGDPPEASQTLARLLAAGASRHAAIHAIASIVAKEMQAVMKNERVYDREATARRLEHLRPADWAW
jgi:hypothetical protein